MAEFKLRGWEKFLVYMAGISLPLITIRLELQVLSMSLFMISMVLLILYNFRMFSNHIVISLGDILISAFLIVTLASTLYSINIEYSFMKWVKLLLVVILFFQMKALFYKKPYYADVIMKLAAISLSLYLVFLGWHYLIKFQKTYIGIETAYATGAGKNSLAFMVSFILPYTLVSTSQKILRSKLKLLDLGVVLISLLGAILIQSRALFILIIFYLLVVLIAHRQITFRTTMAITLIILVLIVLQNTSILPRVITDLLARVKSLVLLFRDDYVASEDRAIAGIGSVVSRKYFIEKGINMFMEKPILGHGLGSYIYYGALGPYVCHNDYVQIAAELGLVGLIIFIIIIVYFNLSVLFNYLRNKENLWLFMSMMGMSTYLFMINAYDNIMFWTLMAMISASNVDFLKHKIKHQQIFKEQISKEN